jgi:acetate kinase
VNILVINSGSSSIKYQLLDAGSERRLATGLIERIGEQQARLTQRWGDGQEHEEAVSAPDHRTGLAAVFALLERTGVLQDVSKLSGIGHRVVHGGVHFTAPVVVDEDVLAQLEALSDLAPLHNPANITGIEVARELAGGVPQVAVFDTAFHQSLPPHASHYALPRELQRRLRIRRYGFHGTSHQYVAKATAEYLGRPLASLRMISLHLGNGASATAIEGGRSVETSMGFTPLEGLVMGTRCGDLDASVPAYLAEREGLDAQAVAETLNRESGLKGLCGDSDMREIERRVGQGDQTAALALDMFCYRAKKYIGAYVAVLGGLDALVFTAGIGENSAGVRAKIGHGLELLGIVIDEARNLAARGAAEISEPGSTVRVLVIPTDEELEIARATRDCITAVASGQAVR